MSFIKKNPKSMRDFKFYFLNFGILLLAVSISGCIMDNPAHSPPIEGTIDILENSKGDLCFIPIFSSAISSGDLMKINHIKMKELAVLDPTRQGGGYVLLRITPINDEYYILEDGEEICLNTDNPDLKQTIYTPLDKQLLSVSIGGLDDKKKYSVNFYREFNYPYTLK